MGSEDSRRMNAKTSAASAGRAARAQTHFQRVSASRCPMATSRRRGMFSWGLVKRCATSNRGLSAAFLFVPGNESSGVCCIPDSDRYDSRIMIIILPSPALPDCPSIVSTSSASIQASDGERGQQRHSRQVPRTPVMGRKARPARAYLNPVERKQFHQAFIRAAAIYGCV